MNLVDDVLRESDDLMEDDDLFQKMSMLRSTYKVRVVFEGAHDLHNVIRMEKSVEDARVVEHDENSEDFKKPVKVVQVSQVFHHLK